MSVHDRPRRNQLCRRPHSAAVQAAVDIARKDPCSNGDFDGLQYRVDEGYYPEEWTHWVDLSEVPPDRRHGASLAVISALVQRGFGVNSVRWDPPRLHVVRIDWFDERRRSVPASA